MKEGFTITYSDDKTEEDYILKRLKEYNREKVPNFPEKVYFNFMAKDETGNIIGGIKCKVHWGWLHIDLFWVDDNYRGKGIGTNLIQQAEKEALKHNIAGAYVETADFQALDFYQKEGYTIFGEADNMPIKGRKCYWLKHEQLNEKHRKK